MDIRGQEEKPNGIDVRDEFTNPGSKRGPGLFGFALDDALRFCTSLGPEEDDDLLCRVRQCQAGQGARRPTIGDNAGM